MKRLSAHACEALTESHMHKMARANFYAIAHIDSGVHPIRGGGVCVFGKEGARPAVRICYWILGYTRFVAKGLACRSLRVTA